MTIWINIDDDYGDEYDTDDDEDDGDDDDDDEYDDEHDDEYDDRDVVVYAECVACVPAVWYIIALPRRVGMVSASLVDD